MGVSKIKFIKGANIMAVNFYGNDLKGCKIQSLC